MKILAWLSTKYFRIVARAGAETRNIWSKTFRRRNIFEMIARNYLWGVRRESLQFSWQFTLFFSLFYQRKTWIRAKPRWKARPATSGLTYKNKINFVRIYSAHSSTEHIWEYRPIIFRSVFLLLSPHQGNYIIPKLALTRKDQNMKSPSVHPSVRLSVCLYPFWNQNLVNFSVHFLSVLSEFKGSETKTSVFDFRFSVDLFRILPYCRI